MVNKQIRSEIEQLGNIKTLVQAYEEIAASYMRRIRSNVIQKREFLDGLSLIFQQVKTSYKSEIKTLMAKKGSRKNIASFRTQNGKTVLVLISANTGLYGDIVKRTFDLFLEQIRVIGISANVDIAIIGRLGNQLLQFENIKKPYAYFDFPDNKIDSEELRKIVGYLLEYEQIYAFYGKFQTVVSQVPTRSNISGDQSENKQEQQKPQPVIKYIFEPSLENIFTFFESEILVSIFEQTMYESQLAKFASRMITLDKASENIRQSLNKANFAEQKYRHRALNAKQLNGLSSVMMWSR